MPPYIFQQGETISLALDAVSGDPADVSAIAAQLKALPPGRTTVPVGAPIAAAFVISPRAASGDVPPGWTLSIAAEPSAQLQAGSYLADARLSVASGVIITESISLRIAASVTS
jgi:hypothetical protein